MMQDRPGEALAASPGVSSFLASLDVADARAAGGRARPVGTSEAKRERGPEGGPTQGPQAPSWYIANKVSTAGQRGSLTPDALAVFRESRRVRLARRATSSEWLIREARVAAGRSPVAPEGTRAGDDEWIRPPRPARCRWRVAEHVGVHGDEHGAHFSGTERCASIWACPVCSAVIRKGRADEIQRAVENWQAQGGHVVFVTLTVRHQASDRLQAGLDAVMKSWQDMQRGRWWGDFKARYGVEGMVRAIEVTHGANGWHPHLHALVFVRQPISDADLASWEQEMFQRWVDLVDKHGGGLPTKLRGIDLRRADKDGKVVAQYLAKVQEHERAARENEDAARDDAGVRYGIGQEMARFDRKEGRHRSLTPFELLDDIHAADEDDDDALRLLWCEYVATTKGRRAITWSHGLRARLLPDEEQRTDEELIDDAEQAPLRFLVPAEAWRRAQNQPAVLALALEAVEDGDIETARYLLGGVYPEDMAAVERGESLSLEDAIHRQGLTVVPVIQQVAGRVSTEQIRAALIASVEQRRAARLARDEGLTSTA